MAANDQGKPKTQSTGIIPGQFGGISASERDAFKSIRIPSSPPIHFPQDLWAQTSAVLLESRTKFPKRAQILEFCKHVTAEMTPVFEGAVKKGKMKPGAVLAEAYGGMWDLLHSLLAENDDGIKSGPGRLSGSALSSKERVRESVEWSALVKAMVEAEQSINGTDPVSAGSNRAQSSAVQDNVKTAQGTATDRRALVDAYIREVHSKKHKRITRKDIWTRAGYKTRTEFERWERQDAKHRNKAADERFTQLLTVEKPHLK